MASRPAKSIAFAAVLGALLWAAGGRDAGAEPGRTASKAGESAGISALALSIGLGGAGLRAGTGPLSWIPGSTGAGMPGDHSSLALTGEVGLAQPRDLTGGSLLHFLRDCLTFERLSPRDAKWFGPSESLQSREIPLRVGEGFSILFCNPYFVRYNIPRDEESGPNTDTTDDFSFGVLGALSGKVWASAFSTLSVGTLRFGPEALQQKSLSEHTSHRFAMALRVFLKQDLCLGACAGAVISGRAERTTPEFFVDLKLRF
jgi:hypothetical protein